MSTSSDTPKEEIDQLYATLQQRFSTGVTRSLGWRLYNLKQLAWMIEDNRKAIHEAVKKDLGGGGFSVDMSDLFPIINEIDLAVKRLPKWVKDESRVADSMLSFKSMSPIVKKQPKGVVLIISPWNYPWQLTFGPLVAAIAAGCPAVIKPSESSSASSELMARLVPLYLDTQAYGIVLGAAEVSTHLLKKPWGHVMYTGSDRVGKIVAKAAADTLTPSTLELGGKSPVIITKDADLHKAARRMFSIKQLTTGQMCVTPDHVLVEKEVVDEFIRISKETLDAFYPPSPHPGSLLHCGMASHFMTEQSYARQVGFVEKAEEQGKLVYKGEMDASTRRMGFSLVKLAEDGVGETGGLVEEEIFGAVVPIIPVSSLDKAIEWINARPHPLALYVCSSKQSTFDTVVERTTSGSATWNDFCFATLARSMPFGGVGGSGWGAYHGYDGFCTFTHFKSTLQIPYLFEPLMSLRYPPMSSTSQYLLTLLLSSSLPNRPKSAEDEERKLWWRKWRGTMLIVLGLLAAGVLGGGVAGIKQKLIGWRA